MDYFYTSLVSTEKDIDRIENSELALLAQKSKDYLELFIRKNIKLIITIYKEFNIDINDDTLQVGILGLIEAIKNYDANKGLISTYSSFWIKNEIFEYLNTNRNVSYSRTVIRDINKLKKIKDNTNNKKEFEKKLKIANISSVKAEELEGYNYRIISYDELFDSEEFILDTKWEEDIIDKIYHEDIYLKLNMILQKILTKKEYDVIYQYFGFNGESINLTEISKQNGTSRQASSLKLKKGLQKIKESEEVKRFINDVL